jgi:hypothetical protein
MAAPWTLLHGGALGDLVLAIQLALRLPEVGASGRLSVIARASPGDLSACHPSVRWRSSEGLGLHWLFGDHDDAPPAALREVISDQRVLSFLGGTHTIAHHRLAELQPAVACSVDPRPRDEITRHIVEQWRVQIEQQGVLVPKCVHQRPAARALGVPAALRERGGALFAALGVAQDAVVIHPGSGGRRKCWGLSHYLDVARDLASSALGPAETCFLVGPVEMETWEPSVLENIRRAFPLVTNPAPEDLTAVLAAARLLLGNDAGPAHLAALLGTPTVTLFGATSPHIWRPLGAGGAVIEGDPEAPGGDWGIEVERVSAAVRAVSRG